MHSDLSFETRALLREAGVLGAKLERAIALINRGVDSSEERVRIEAMDKAVRILQSIHPQKPSAQRAKMPPREFAWKTYCTECKREREIHPDKTGRRVCLYCAELG